MRANAVHGFRAFAGMVLLTVSTIGAAAALAQGAVPGGWAADDDPVAKAIIARERQWATLACAPRDVAATAATALVTDLIADDFVGTSPRGSLYTKADMLPKADAPLPKPERGCELLSAKLRYFGPDVAVVYGTEKAVVEGPDGKEASRVLVWTDTFLRRAGRWQIIAVQDMVPPAK